MAFQTRSYDDFLIENLTLLSKNVFISIQSSNKTINNSICL